MVPCLLVSVILGSNATLSYPASIEYLVDSKVLFNFPSWEDGTQRVHVHKFVIRCSVVSTVATANEH